MKSNFNIYILYIISFVCIHLLLGAKSCDAQVKGYLLGYKIDNNDTIYQIKLKEVYVFNRPTVNKNSRQWREYYRLVYNFKKVYPYALIAKNKIRIADSVLKTKNYSNSEKEKFIKQFEGKLFAEFEKPLKKMTISQGRLLLKLVDREVGQSSFYLIKNYKGGFNAFFWQGIAKIFGSDLKAPYDRYGEDKAVEELVTMYKIGAFDYLYYSIY